MAPKDYFTLGVAILALVVSLIGVSRTWRVSVATFRNVSRNNYMNALFDLNRQAVLNPRLWAVYDPVFAAAMAADPLEKARLQAFIWYHLNLFEIVHADYVTHRLTPLDAIDKQHWKSFDNFITSFLKESPEAQIIVNSERSASLLNESFIKYLREKLPVQQAVPVSAGLVGGLTSRAARD